MAVNTEQLNHDLARAEVVIQGLIGRVLKLEADSHPPIMFEECPDCHCMVAPGKMLEHSSVHPDPWVGPDGEDYN